VAQVGRNKTLWVVGDSVSRQFFAALSCLLERATGLPPRLLEAPRDRSSIPQVLQDDKGYVHKLSRFGGGVTLFAIPQCILVPTADGHCTVCYVWSMKTVEGLSILQRIGVDRTETVVMNWGLHIWASKNPARDLEALLSGWREFCRTRDGRCARLVWRETSAQHFSGSAGGLYSQTASTPCVAHTVSDYRNNNKLNLEVNDTLAAYPEVLKLPVWKLTADRFDAHPGATPNQKHKSDCTHWCARTRCVAVRSSVTSGGVAVAGGKPARCGARLVVDRTQHAERRFCSVCAGVTRGCPRSGYGCCTR
jgi:hypothetical protein